MPNINSVEESNSLISFYQILQFFKRRRSLIFYCGLIYIFFCLFYIWIFINPVYRGTSFIASAFFKGQILYSKDDVVRNFSLPGQYSKNFYETCQGAIVFDTKSKTYPEHIIIVTYEGQDITLTKLCTEILSADLIDFQNRLLEIQRHTSNQKLIQLDSELTFLKKYLDNSSVLIQNSRVFEKNQLRFYSVDQEISELKNKLSPPSSVESVLAAPILVSKNSNRTGILKIVYILFAVWLFITILILLFLESSSKRLGNR